MHVGLAKKIRLAFFLRMHRVVAVVLWLELSHLSSVYKKYVTLTNRLEHIIKIDCLVTVDAH